MEKQYLHVYTPTRPRSPSISGLFHKSASVPDNLSRGLSPPRLETIHFDQSTTDLQGQLHHNHHPAPSNHGSDEFNTKVPFNEYCSKRMRRIVPIIKWLPTYTWRKLLHDFMAGLLVGLTLIPQALALALMAGLPPHYGLYSSFMGCFVYVFLGSTSYITIGPTAIMSIMTWTYGHDKPPEYAVLLTFVTGVMTLALGLMQLGFIVNFISIPVASGFTSAAAITICYTQTKAILGIQFTGVSLIEIASGSVRHIKEVGMWDVIVACICLALLLVLRKLELIFSCLVKRGKPWSKIIWLISVSKGIIVTAVCTIVFAAIGSETIVGILGEIRQGIPTPTPPPFSFEINMTHPEDKEQREIWSYTLWDLIQEDGTALLVLPFLALMEHSLNAKQFAGSKSIDSTQELIAIGMSNICASFFSSMPITGAFPRTGVNAASGVETPLGGIVTGILVLVSLQFLTPCFYYMPKPAIGAMNIISAIFTIDFMMPRRLWRCKKMDLIPWVATFSVSLFAGLEYGVLLGFLISVVFLLYWAASPKIRVNRCKLSSTGARFILVDLDRSLTFPSAEYTRTVLMKCGDRWAAGHLPVVIDCFHMHFADYTAAQGILELYKVFNAKRQPLLLFRLKPSVERIVTELMIMDDVAYHSCQSQSQLQEVLRVICPPEPGYEVKVQGEVLHATNAEEYDLSTDSASPSLIYPDNTKRQHIARVDFTMGSKPMRKLESYANVTDDHGPDSPVEIHVSEH